MAKRKMVYNNLVKNSISAYFAAVELHNKPNIAYGYETVTLLMMNAWELALKAYVKKNSKTGEHFAIAAPVGDHETTSKSGKKYLYPAKNIAAHIEYGTSHQPPKPYVDMAARAAEAEATQAMQEAIDKKTKEMGL